jgi:peptide/nickel transport system substrate-binding protein
MRVRVPSVLAVIAIAVAGCQGTASPVPSAIPASAPAVVATSVAPTSAPSPTPVDFDQLLYGATYQPTAGQPGGKVVLGEWQAATQLDPWFSNAFVNSEVFAATMRTLLRVSADGHWQPDLAAGPITYRDSVTKDASGTGFSVHVTLKPDLKWSDGEPLTLEDYKYTWQWVNDKAQVGLTPLGFELIDRIDVAPDGLSAEIHFKEAFAGWLGTVGGNYIMPAHYLRTIPIKDAAAKSYPLSPDITKAPASGPFKYVTASADTVELARNELWAGPTGACSGRACLDAVTYKYYPDNKEGEIAAFRAGEIDVALSLVQADYDAIKDVDPTIGKALLEPGWLYEHLDMNEAGLGKGAGHPALQDIVVRKAMAQAIDKKALWSTVFPGTPAPAEEPCTNATPTNYWTLPDATCPAFDLAAANKALDDAGYALGPDGVRVDPKSKLPLVFVNCTLNGYRALEAEALAKALEAIGIKLELNNVDGSTVLFAGWSDVKADTKCNLAHGTYDLAEFAYVLGFDLYGDYYYSYHSEQIPTEANKGNGYDTLRYASPEMDAAIDVLAKSIDPADQVEAAYKVQQVYIDQVPEIVLYYRNEARGVSARLQDFFKNPSTSSDMWNIEDWWLKP